MRKHRSRLPFISLQILSILSSMLAACIAKPVITLTTLPAKTATVSAPQTTEGKLLVAFIKSGDIQVWNEATEQIQTIVNSGDVSRVKISDDSQVIAYLRRSYTLLPDRPLERVSLWAIDSDGGNPRELVSIEVLEQRLNAGPTESFGIAEMEWIPGTHRLVYSGTKVYDPGSDFRAPDEDIYLVDADTARDRLLASAIDEARASDFPFGQQLVPSPDGSQVAILHDAYLSFVNADGSNLRQAIWSFGVPGSFPFTGRGIWTQDNRALIVNAPVVSGDPAQGINFAISRVPADGSAADIVATITNSDPSSVTLSPDGARVAYRSEGESGMVWLNTPLATNVGPLAIPNGHQFDSINLHWSPTGEAYAFDQGNLWQLCPDAADGSQFCADPFEVSGNVRAIRWIDSSRFLFLTGDPEVLFLRNSDGTTTPIAVWPLEEHFHPFTAAVISE